jgi:hypothetical protein
MSIPAPTLLTLPQEIRLQIYANLCPSLCLLSPPSLLSSIASVCRQTRQEIFPLVLQVTRYFWTVERLWDWTSQGEQRNLELVSEISFTFTEDWVSKFWTLEQVRKAIDDDPVPYSGQWWELAYLMGLQSESFKPACQVHEQKELPKAKERGRVNMGSFHLNSQSSKSRDHFLKPTPLHN